MTGDESLYNEEERGLVLYNVKQKTWHKSYGFDIYFSASSHLMQYWAPVQSKLYGTEHFQGIQ